MEFNTTFNLSSSQYNQNIIIGTTIIFKYDSASKFYINDSNVETLNNNEYNNKYLDTDYNYHSKYHLISYDNKIILDDTIQTNELKTNTKYHLYKLYYNQDGKFITQNKMLTFIMVNSIYTYVIEYLYHNDIDKLEQELDAVNLQIDNDNYENNYIGIDDLMKYIRTHDINNFNDNKCIDTYNNVNNIHTDDTCNDICNNNSTHDKYNDFTTHNNVNVYNHNSDANNINYNYNVSNIKQHLDIIIKDIDKDNLFLDIFTEFQYCTFEQWLCLLSDNNNFINNDIRNEYISNNKYEIYKHRSFKYDKNNKVILKTRKYRENAIYQFISYCILTNNYETLDKLTSSNNSFISNLNDNRFLTKIEHTIKKDKDDMSFINMTLVSIGYRLFINENICCNIT